MKESSGASLPLRLFKRLGVIGAVILTTIFSIAFSASITTFVYRLSDSTGYARGLFLSTSIPALLTPVLSYVVYTLMDRLYKHELQLRSYAQEDTLTGTYNRRYFTDLAQKELTRAKRYDLPLSMVMLDIDQFKNINDQKGHLVGDAVLQSVGSQLRETLRTSDIVGRFGGDEFLILLTHTGAEKADEIAQRVQNSLGFFEATDNDEAVHYQISLGLSTLQNPGQSFDDLVRIADQNMYRAKRNKRSQ